MMVRVRHFEAVLALAATFVAVGTAAPAWAHNADLLKKYEYTVGDAIAYRMESIFRITAGLEAATLVYYDRESQNIVAEILGGCDDAAGAKREIEAYVEAIRANVVDYAKKRHRVTLTDADVTLIYYCDSDEGVPVEVVRRENGVFVTAPTDDNEGGAGDPK
jgi:hypothetical protein